MTHSLALVVRSLSTACFFALGAYIGSVRDIVAPMHQLHHAPNQWPGHMQLLRSRQPQ